MLKTIATLIFAAAGLQKLDRGTFILEKGKRMEGIELEMTIPVKNNGGAPAAMSDAERMALLALFKIKDFNYGKAGAITRYANLGFDRIRTMLFNRCYGTDFVGYSNSTNGLAKSIANGATDNLVVNVIIPTGKDIRCPQYVQGMGRSQAASLFCQFELTALSSTGTGNFAINGSVTVSVRPDPKTEPRGNVWANLLEVYDSEDTRKEFDLLDGETLDVWDRNAAHESTSYTSNTYKVGDEVMFKEVAPSVVSAQNDRVANVPTAFTNGRTYYTEIFAQPFDVKANDIQTGKPHFEQNNKVVATSKFTQVYRPLESQDKLSDFTAHAAKSLAKPLHLVSFADMAGANLHERKRFAAGHVLRDAQDAEYNSLPGLTGDGVSEVAVMRLPPLVISRARLAIKSAEASEAPVLAEKIQRQIASSVPGGITNGRGVKQGVSAAMDFVRRAIG